MYYGISNASTITADDAWGIWTANECTTVNTTASNCTAADYATGDRVWLRWNTVTTTTGGSGGSGYVTTTATTSDKVWTKWNSSVVYYPGEYYGTPPRPEPLPVLHDAHVSAYQVEQVRLAQLAYERRQKEKAAAETRAKELLLRHLTKDQREQHAKDMSFIVRGEDGVAYRVKKGWAGNVEELNQDGKPVARYCIHPKEEVPESDNQLIQKFMLETDVKRFKQTANRTEIAVR